MSQVLDSKPVANKAVEPERTRRVAGRVTQVTLSAPLPLQTLLYLQKFAGNAAVAEMIAAATEREVPQRPESPAPAPGAAAPPATADGSSPTASADGPAAGASPSATTLVGEVAGVAMPVVGAVASPFASVFGSLFGPAAAPAPPQANGQAPAEPQAADQKAPAGETHAPHQPGAEGAAATAGAVRPVEEKGASAAGAATAEGAAKGGEASPAGAARPVDQRPAGAAGAADAKGGQTSPGAGDRPVDQRPAGAAGAADGAKGAETSAGAGAAPEVAAQPATPATDPNFLAVKSQVHAKAGQSRQHPPAGTKVAEAQSAAHGPANEVASQAGAAQVDKMSAQQPGGFDKKAFMDAVRKAIDAAAPHNLDEANDFKDSGKAGQIQGQVSGLVGQNKQAAEQGIKGATEAAPDTSAAKPKPVTPMPAEQPGAPPPPVGAGSAMPSPKSADEVSLAKGPAEVNASMQEADVTEPQLKESNEPEFTGALDAKQTAEKHSQEAPQAFRKEEQGVLDKARGSASASADHGMQAMHGDRTKALTAVGAGKGQAKTQDEARRAEVSTKIEGIYGKTKDEVTVILNGIDPQVDVAFKDGEGKARAAFESYVDTKVSAYKDDRYSGLRGKWRWIKDKFKGLPGEVNQFYAQGRELYLSRMEGVIGGVADIVGRELTRAKDRIALGQTQISQYVGSLPADLKKVGQEAQQNIQSKFDELTQSVDAKQEDLVNSLAQKYVESRDAVDAHIKEMKDANKGLIDKAKDAVMGVINTIRHLKDMLLGVLMKAVSVIGSIIAHPIRFLGNLVEGVKAGLTGFMSNIGEHLKKGLLGWLFGALGEAGLQLPEKFDLKGILHIIMQVLGLTYSHIRGLAVGIVGEEVVGHLEKSLEFFQVLIKEGPGGLWKWIVEKLSELKETVMTKIKEFIQEKVIIAGIMWLIGLLNPVAAFIKACKAIYDIVKFFIDRAEQVGELVNAIVDSVGALAGGALGEAAGKVENALAKGIPVAIGFLASLLGLGGISDKIKSIIHAIQEPIHNIIGKVLGVVLKPFKWIGKKIKQGAAWAKKKVEQGVTYVKDKAKQGVAWVKGKAAAAVGRVKQFLGPKVGFDGPDEHHEVWAEARGAGPPQIVVASKSEALESRLEKYEKRANGNDADLSPEEREAVLGLIEDAKQQSKKVRAKQFNPDQLATLIPQLAGVLRQIEGHLFSGRAAKQTRINYVVDKKGRAWIASGGPLKIVAGARDESAQASLMDELKGAELTIRGEDVGKPADFTVSPVGLPVGHKSQPRKTKWHWGTEGGYEAGHLIADKLGGSGGRENLVPMSYRTNTAWFTSFESLIKSHIKKGGGIFAEVQAEYSPDITKGMPERFKVYDDDGDKRIVGSSFWASYIRALNFIPDYVQYRVWRERPGKDAEPILNSRFAAEDRGDLVKTSESTTYEKGRDIKPEMMRRDYSPARAIADILPEQQKQYALEYIDQLETGASLPSPQDFKLSPQAASSIRQRIKASVGL